MTKQRGRPEVSGTNSLRNSCVAEIMKMLGNLCAKQFIVAINLYIIGRLFYRYQARKTGFVRFADRGSHAKMS